MTILNNGITNSIALLTKEPLSDRLKTASLNTLLGMGIVFAVLTLIILIISLLKYLPGILEVKKNYDNESDVRVTPVDNAIAQIISQEETNLMNDQELVAVITAAIYEYSRENTDNVSTGGFIVRSIQKIINRRIS